MTIDSMPSVAAMPRPATPPVSRETATPTPSPASSPRSALRVAAAKPDDEPAEAYRTYRKDGEPTDPDATGGLPGRIDSVA